MPQPSLIERYLANLQRLGQLAEKQFLDREWQAQRELPAMALDEADALLKNGKLAGLEAHISPIQRAHAWACREVSGGATAEPLPNLEGSSEIEWRDFESLGNDTTSPLEKAIRSPDLLDHCRHFASGKGLSFQADTQFLPVSFFRNQRVYLIARTLQGASYRCVLLAFTVADERVVLDAVLTSEEEITPVFEFSRALLIPKCNTPLDFVPWIEELLPGKPRWQVLLNTGYTVLGRALLLAELQRHLLADGERLDIAPGTPGMVMIVFHLPSFPVVFKVIKDRPDPPKDVGREQVLRKYRFVAEHDRVGRLADSHLFENMRLPLDALKPDLVQLLHQRASSAFKIEEDQIVFREVLTERRMMPLNLLLDDPATNWRPLLEEYADAIEDLAWANLFPGDLLPKNFGVTKHGRVVFYDFDEVDSVTSCRFRRLPDDPDTDLISLGPNDVFPEEWPPFLFRNQEHRNYLTQNRPSIFDYRFWKQCQDCYERGDFVDLFPYQSQRTPDFAMEGPG